MTRTAFTSSNHRRQASMQLNQTVVQVMQGDIIQQVTDAIVTPASAALMGGRGLDGAVHRAAGPQLRAVLAQIGGCETGDARISDGYRLQARYIIHAVGPIYNYGEDDALLLASAYRKSLELAQGHNLESIALPAISTGVYGYPLDEAAEIATRTVCEFVMTYTTLKLVRFVLESEDEVMAFKQALRHNKGDLLALS